MSFIAVFLLLPLPFVYVMTKYDPVYNKPRIWEQYEGMRRRSRLKFFTYVVWFYFSRCILAVILASVEKGDDHLVQTSLFIALFLVDFFVLTMMGVFKSLVAIANNALADFCVMIVAITALITVHEGSG